MIPPNLDVITRLSNPKKVGDGKWETRCPVHNGDGQSLSVTLTPDGKWLFHCHAHKCAYKDILAAIGLDQPTQPKPRTNGQVPQMVSKGCMKYIYTYGNGNPTMMSKRFDSDNGTKRFEMWQHKQGKWITGVPKANRPLYNLVAVMAASTVYVCEGEKVADRLISLDLTATTSIGGSGASSKTDWSPLAGKQVIILPDNDEPGEKYAAKVGGILSGLGCTVRIIHLNGLEYSEDFIQWLQRLPETTDAVAALDELVSNTKPIQQPGLVVTSLNDVSEVDTKWLWNSRIPLENITLLAGDGGLGKSWLALDLAAKVSSGTAWPDDRNTPNPAGDVFLLDNENHPGILKKRLRTSGADMSRIHLVKGVVHPESDGVDMFSLDRDLRHLEREIRKFPETRLVVIDVLGAYIGSGTDTHKDSDVRRCLMPLADFAERLGIAVLALHHLNKGASKALYRITGSGAFGNTCRAVWLVSSDEEDQSNNPRRLFTCVKNNLATKPSGLAFNFGPSPNGDIQLQWDSEPVMMTADEALGEPNKARLPRHEAEEYLRIRLADGPVSSQDLKSEITECETFSWKTAIRASNVLGVRKSPVLGEKGRATYWEWSLPLREREGK